MENQNPNAFDKQLKKVVSEIMQLHGEAGEKASKASFSHDRAKYIGMCAGYNDACKLIKPLINNPILMTFDHKDCFKLEDLLSLIVEEVKIKNGKLASADLPEGDKLIYESSNLTIITLLTIAQAIQKEAIELVHGGLDEDEKNARAEQFLALNAAVVSPFEDLGE